MNRPTSPAGSRDRLDELVDDDAAAMVPTHTDRPGPIATALAVASIVLVGVLAAVALTGWWMP